MGHPAPSCIVNNQTLPENTRQRRHGEISSELMNTTRRWVYVLPALHLLVCAVLLFGSYVLGWSTAGLLWGFLVLLDLPASLPYYFAAWSHGTMAALWIIVVGTIWWYLVSRAIDRLMTRVWSKDLAA